MNWLWIVLVLLFVIGCAASPIPPRIVPGGAPPGCSPPSPDEAPPLLLKTALVEDEFLQLVELTHPRLQSARQDIEAAVARKLQAGILPNPTLFAEVEDLRVNAFESGNKTILGIAYPLAIGGRISAASEAAGQERLYVEAQVAALRREILRDAREALYGFLFARETVKLDTQLERIALEFQEGIARRRSEKSVLELELIKADVELATREMESISSTRQMEIATVRLRSWVADDCFDPSKLAVEWPVAGTLPPLSSLLGALDHHPILQASARAVDLAEAVARLADAQAIPDVKMSLSGARTRDPGEAPEAVVQFGFEIPIPLFDRNQGRRAETEILIRKARIDQEGARRSLAARLTEAVRSVERHQARLARILERLLPPSEKAVGEADTLYRERKILNIDALDAQRTLAGARRLALEARHDLAVAVAELESITGGGR